MRDGTSKSPSRPRSRRNLAVSGSACTALGRPAVEPYTGSPTMALRRDVAPASPVATRLPRTTRLRLGLGATLRCQAPPAPPSAALRSSHTPARPQWLYGAMWLLLRPSPRAYLVLRAFASLSVARSV